MTASDSEDFESADEDIEPEFSSIKSKIRSELENPEVKNDEAKFSGISRTVHSVSCLTVEEQNAENLDKEKNTKSSDLVLCAEKENPDIGISKTKKEENVMTPDVDSDMQESTSHEKSSIERISNEGTGEHKLVRSHRGKRPQRTKESKYGPMKLGVRVISDNNKTSDDNNYEIKSNEELTVSNESEVSYRQMEEKNTREPEVYASVLDKLSTSSDSTIPQEKEKGLESAQQQTPNSSGWGFGKSFIGSGGWGNVGGWGSSLLSTATLSVTTLGSHVTQGISTVLETVEAGIGAPSPEELARKIKEESKKQSEENTNSFGKEEEIKEDQHNEEEPDELEMEAWGDWNEDGHEDGSKTGTGLLNLVSGVTQVTGKVLSTGLDTLETIGKKTMEVLQEGDPGFKKKRALLLGDDNVVLSQVLREAKEKAEAEELEAEEKEAMRKAHFETLFDDYQGLVHLEALEMLSRQSDLRLKSMLLKETGPTLKGLHIRLAAVQEMCEISDQNEDEEDISNLVDILPDALKKLKLEISADKLLQSCNSSRDWLETMKSEVGSFQATPRVIHQEAITALATLTANAIEFFHKTTELLLVKEGKSREIKEEARVMVGITIALTAEVNKIAADFSEFLSAKLNDDSLSAADKEKIESFITNIFLEASNSSTYIQDAFQLMVPVLQLGAVA